VRLGDESVGEEDAETVLSAAATRLMDLLAGELKLQVLDGHWGRARRLLEVARGAGFDERKWTAALRPLRSLFRTEAAGLEPLLGDRESPRLEDVELYLRRVSGLAGRWASLDPEGWLGLNEVIDEAVGKAVAVLSQHENYGLIDRLKKSLTLARDSAASGSLKRRIEAQSERLDGLSRWECHFCRAREADPQYSALLSGKKETHRTQYGNTITIHYQIMRDIVQRCGRCADFHEYLRSVKSLTRGIMIVPFAIVWLYIFYNYVTTREVIPLLILLGIAGVVTWVGASIAAAIAQSIAAHVFTPKGERAYWKYKDSRQYKGLRSEGFGEITLDMSRNAFENAVKNRK
jgi:hypothetical protein